MEGITALAGGVWLGTPVAARMIDIARANSVAIAAGVQTAIMNDREMSIVKLDGDAVAEWLPEGVKATQSQQTFGRVVLRAQTLRAHVPITEELIMDAPNAPVAIEEK